MLSLCSILYYVYANPTYEVANKLICIVYMSANYHCCSDISGLCSNDVCSESKLQSGILEHKLDMSIYGNCFQNYVVYG